MSSDQAGQFHGAQHGRCGVHRAVHDTAPAPRRNQQADPSRCAVGRGRARFCASSSMTKIAVLLPEARSGSPPRTMRPEGQVVAGHQGRRTESSGHEALRVIFRPSAMDLKLGHSPVFRRLEVSRTKTAARSVSRPLVLASHVQPFRRYVARQRPGRHLLRAPIPSTRRTGPSRHRFDS